MQRQDMVAKSGTSAGQSLPGLGGASAGQRRRGRRARRPWRGHDPRPAQLSAALLATNVAHTTSAWQATRSAIRRAGLDRRTSASLSSLRRRRLALIDGARERTVSVCQRNGARRQRDRRAASRGDWRSWRHAWRTGSSPTGRPRSPPPPLCGRAPGSSSTPSLRRARASNASFNPSNAASRSGS